MYSVPVFPVGLNNIVCGLLPYLGRTTFHYSFIVRFKCHHEETYITVSSPLLEFGDVNGTDLYSLGITYKHIMITLNQINSDISTTIKAGFNKFSKASQICYEEYL